MLPNENTFKSVSHRVAADFLQSVVVVDDQAYLHQSESTLKTLNAPSKGGPGSKKTPPDSKPNGGLSEKQRQDLDAKTLIDAFAEKGLVCAVLRPVLEDTADGELKQRTTRATERADIVVLDWRINDEALPGETTLGLIRTIIAADSEYKGRLRLIAIYTGEPDLSKVADEINKALNDSNVDNTREGFVFKSGPVRISLFAKEGVRTVDGEIKSRIFSESNLPERLIEEFTNMTAGLLSNIALRSLGALRHNTHRILNKFASDLDAPYISHRALMSPPEEAAEHPLPILASEILDVLEDSGVTDSVSPEEISRWIEWSASNDLQLDVKMPGMSSQDVSNALLDLLKHGLEGEKSSEKHAAWAELISDLKASNKDALSN